MESWTPATDPRCGQPWHSHYGYRPGDIITFPSSYVLNSDPRYPLAGHAGSCAKVTRAQTHVDFTAACSCKEEQ